MMQDIGERFRQVREGLGLDQDTFGSSLGAARNTIYRWEKGLGYPPADVLFKLHENYGINIHWLVTGQDKMRESIQPTAQPQAPNSDILLQVISRLEDGITRHKVMLGPDKKARLILVLYEYSIETGKPIGPDTVDRYLGLMT